MSLLTVLERGTPNTPAAGRVHLYVKPDGKVYKKNSAGVESEVGSTSTAEIMASIYASAAISLTQNVFIKLALTGIEFNLGDGYKIATGRFNPSVAGYYAITSAVALTTSAARIIMQIRKNGTEYKSGPDSGSGNVSAGVNSLAYLNGTTDYLEVYVLQDAATQNIDTLAYKTYIQAYLISRG